MYKHILVATDGSELARKGLEHGLALAKQLDAKVTILSVSEPMHPEAARAAQKAGIENVATRYDQQLESLMKERFAFIEGRAKEYGITVGLTHEIDDSAAEAIVRVAKLSGCDLIVMSSHGRRGVQKMLLGSQTSEVLVKTPIPVLVIR
ncbi:MAG: universal stress protein [Rhodobacteraceae bacterium]|nr:universal stress protein [Paracoccaceae bacterium]